MPPASTIDNVVRLDAEGNPITLGQSIVNCVRLGQSMYGASRSNGISADLAWKWRQRGFLAASRRARGEEVAADQEAYEAFVYDLERAEAEFETRSLARIEQAAQGGGVIRTTRTVEKVDHDGKLVERTTTTEDKQLEGQWTADAWRLERRFPHRYSRMVRNEHSLAEPDPIPTEERLDFIADAAAAYLEGVSDGKALPAVVDAESTEAEA